DEVGAASSISCDRGDGGQASGAPAFQIGGEQREDCSGADKIDLQFFQENIDRVFRIHLVVHGAVSKEHRVKLGQVAASKIEDGSVLLNGGQVSRVSQDFVRAPRC